MTSRAQVANFVGLTLAYAFLIGFIVGAFLV